MGERTVAWGVRGGLAVIGNGVPAIGQVLAPRAAADSLAGSPAFVAASKGMPDHEEPPYLEVADHKADVTAG